MKTVPFPSPSLGNFIYIIYNKIMNNYKLFPSPSLGNFIYMIDSICLWMLEQVSVPISGELYLYMNTKIVMEIFISFRPHLWGTLSIYCSQCVNIVHIGVSVPISGELYLYQLRLSVTQFPLCFRPHLWGTLSI